ncbi:MAG: valine--tRNA ligase [Gemmatimonadaceae bacterium]
MTATRENAELSPQYDAAANESAIYREWEESGVFRAHADRSRRAGGDSEPFVIVMPPPNVTAVLHMGHGLNNAVQDVLIRWRRMSGDEALWLPGTDHAGIATQNVIEKQLVAEGQTRFDLGREAFVARTTSWVEETGGTILQQLRAIGASCDWTRTAYTLSPELSEAVREAFVQLYERGLVYRGHRVIHWCPRCLTSLSDEEAEHSEELGKLYHVRYRVNKPTGAAGPECITVATTRPETMLGDVAIAVHPDDERYQGVVGATATLPIANVEIPIIADAEGVDPTFGTGAVKITPAHDADDFDVGKRHNLPMPVILSPDGRMENGADADHRVPDSLLGLDRFVARERVVEMLREIDQLDKVEPYTHGVRHCYRCDSVVEPRLSDQWFVKMKPLAEPALAAVEEGRIRFLPERWEAVYINWLVGIRDWNISRQLWWGHRIPIWYCDDCGEITASRTDIDKCPKCGGKVHQDPDVLDTWFSSWLWPFSTLGWPDKSSADLRAFYPTDALITAPEILFFWVSRMIMGGFAFMGETPFHTVYLHGTVRDMQHVKMSKSLGNGIDPLDVVSLYGADALRYTVVAGLGMGAELMLDPNDLEKSFAPGRNFVTKLWNIGRFLLSNAGSEPVKALSDLHDASLTRSDRWILHRLNEAIGECSAALGPPRPRNGVWTPEEMRAGLRLSEFVESARKFVWNELADWYVEAVKPRLAGSGEDREVARAVLAEVFGASLRLLHPVVPFITEALWSRLPTTGGTARGLIVTAKWPTANPIYSTESEFEIVREAVMALRQLRAEYSIPPGQAVAAELMPPAYATATKATDASRILLEEASLIQQLARCEITENGPGSNSDTGTHASGKGAMIILTAGPRLFVPLGGVIDIDRECAKARAELDKLARQLESLGARLQNPGFTDRAPADVVKSEKQKEHDWTRRREQLAEKVRSLCGS